MFPSTIYFLCIVAALSTIRRAVAQQNTVELPRIVDAPSRVKIGDSYEITYTPVDMPVVFRAQFGQDFNVSWQISPPIDGGIFTWLVQDFPAPEEGIFLICQPLEGRAGSMDTLDYRYITIAGLTAVPMRTSYVREPMPLTSRSSIIEATMINTTVTLATNSPLETQSMTTVTISLSKDPPLKDPEPKDPEPKDPLSTHSPSKGNLPTMAVAGVGAGVAIAGILFVLAGCAIYKRRQRKASSDLSRSRLHMRWGWNHRHQRNASEDSRPEFKPELDGKGLITVCFCEMNAEIEAQELPAEEKLAKCQQNTEERRRRDSILTDVMGDGKQERVPEQEVRDTESKEVKDEEEISTQKQEESQQEA